MILKKIREKIFKLPTQVILEPTNRCNLNCPYCMVGMQNELTKKHGSSAHNLMSRPQGSMPEETFKKVKIELKDFGVRKVYLHFQGEPFLNKLTPGFAKDLKESGFEVGVFTNGLIFTDESIKELASSSVDLVRFSVDGASSEIYVKNRVGGDFNKALDNMKKVVDAHKGSPTRIEWQFLALKNNEHEIEKAKVMADEIGINFFVKGFRETDPLLVPDNPRYRSKYLKKPCTDIYHQIGIYWNGDVVPCCYDTDGKEIMGNLNNESLKSIWKSEKYKDFRKRVDSFKSNPEKDPCICKTCLRWR